MNLKLLVISFIIFVLGIVLFYISIKMKKNLEENHTIKGKIIDYKRKGRYLYPIIEFEENGEKKVIIKGGTVNCKPIKVGTIIKILKKENGKYLTDSDVKFVRYYAISLMLTFVLLITISLTI